MKKIILAVASVLALGLVVGCKQQIEGSLNVTSTTYTKSLDQSTSKTFYYKATGSLTQTKNVKVETKAVGTSATPYTYSDVTTTTVITPSKDVSVSISEDPTKNYVTYTYTIPYTKKVTVSGTYYNTNATTVDHTVSYTYDIDNQNVAYGPFESSGTIKIYKIDGKYYADAKAQDGSEIVVSEGFDPLAATVALSKFSDTTSTKKEEYTRTGLTTTSTTTAYTNAYSDWTGKTTTTTSGYVSTLSLEKK